MNFYQIVNTLEICLLIVIFDLDLVYKCDGTGEEEKSTKSPDSKSIFGLKEAELVELGNWYFKKEKYDKAIATFTEAINKSDKKASYYVHRANCYAAKEYFLKASKDFEKAIEIAIESGKTESLDVDDAGLLWIGKFLYDTFVYEKAAWCFTEIINKNQSQKEYYELRLKAYDRMGEHEKSILDLKRLLELEADDKFKQDHRVNLIDNFFVLRRYEEALNETRLLNNRYRSDFLYTCRRLGFAEEHELCLSCYTELINRAPNEALYYEERGNLHSKVGDLDSAIADFKERAKLEPKNWISWKELLDSLDDAGKSYELILENVRALDDAVIADVGKAFFSNEEWKHSVLFWDEAIRRNPSDVRNHEWRGKCYLETEDIDAAIFDFKNVVRKAPDNKTARIQLTNLLVKAERYKEAVDVAIMVNDEARIVSVCNTIFSRNKGEEAIRCFTELMKKYPNNADISYEKRALCYVNLKKPGEVIANLENLKAIRPISGHLQLNLCEALIDVGRYDEAAEILEYIDGSNDVKFSNASLERISQARALIAAVEPNKTVANPVAVNA